MLLFTVSWLKRRFCTGGKKSLKVQFVVFSTQFEIITSWSKARITKTSLRPPGSSSAPVPGDPEAPGCLEMDFYMGIAKS